MKSYTKKMVLAISLIAFILSLAVAPAVSAFTVTVQGLAGAQALAAGGRHSLALKNDGSVFAWGDNRLGQTTVPQSLTGVVAIAAGDLHSLALKADGTVVAWGANSYGQTTLPPDLSGVSAIAAGWYHTIALRADGTVVAWGDNRNGQTTVPPGLSGVRTIAAGAYLSVVIKNDGSVAAWGKNGQEQTVTLSTIPGLISVAPGWAHTVALRNTGAIVAWGSSMYGLSTPPTDLAGVVAISSGYLHTVALKAGGTVAAWGKNSEGQTTVPTGLAGVTALGAWVTAIGAGDNHNLALKTDGSLVAWGDNTYGQSSIPAEISGEVANGTVTCASPVGASTSSDCTIIPSLGYHLSSFLVNGVDRLADVSNDHFTIIDIQQNQAVLAAFATVPGAPTMGAVDVDNGRAIVSFSYPGATGGSPITGYTVTASPGAATFMGGANPITVSGLPLGILYTFTVTASNAFGVSAASEPSSPVLVYDPAGTDFDADQVDNLQDNCPFVANPAQQDGDYDGVGDACDPFPATVSEWRDSDGDGVGDNLDNCVTVANPTQTDSDHDALGDACDHNPLPNYGSVVDTPHNQSSGISCSDCHSYTLWWQYAPLAKSDPAFASATNALCDKCHGVGGIASQAAGHSRATMGLTHREGLGDWQTKCVDCHDPHLQAQLQWAVNPSDAAKLYLATGVIGDTVTVSGGRTTFSYTISSALPEWANPWLWQRKNASLPPNGLILVDNINASANNTFKVLAADSNTITVKGGLNPALEGQTFGVIYGQMIKASILTPALVNKAVKFFNPLDQLGGYTDSNTPPAGICQICHQATFVWNNGENGDAQTHTGYGNTQCTACHRHGQGFKPSAN